MGVLKVNGEYKYIQLQNQRSDYRIDTMNRNLAIVIIFGLCIIGSCSVFAAGSFASIRALGRNPSSASKIFTAMLISIVSAQAVAFIAMLISFQLFSAR